jgi:hypothetical protein
MCAELLCTSKCMRSHIAALATNKLREMRLVAQSSPRVTGKK